MDVFSHWTKGLEPVGCPLIGPLTCLGLCFSTLLVMIQNVFQVADKAATTEKTKLFFLVSFVSGLFC